MAFKCVRVLIDIKLACCDCIEDISESSFVRVRVCAEYATGRGGVREIRCFSAFVQGFGVVGVRDT